MDIPAKIHLNILIKKTDFFFGGGIYFKRNYTNCNFSYSKQIPASNQNMFLDVSFSTGDFLQKY